MATRPCHARQLGGMARTTAAAWLAKGVTRVRVEVDDSLFPAPTSALGWKRTYTIEDVSPVRALVVDHHRRWDTSLDAGTVFARKLEKWGLDVRRVARAVRPATSTVVTESHGLDLATQIANMLKTSDNDVRRGAAPAGRPADRLPGHLGRRRRPRRRPR